MSQRQTKLLLCATIALAALPIAYVSAKAQNTGPVNAIVNAVTDANTKMIDASEFVKVSDLSGKVSVANYVDMTPNSTATINKISYGKLTKVSIVSTPTGTYSSDALNSSNVLYPGVEYIPEPPKSLQKNYWNKFSGVKVHTKNGAISVPNKGAPSYWLVYRTESNGYVSMAHDRICTFTQGVTICN